MKTRGSGQFDVNIFFCTHTSWLNQKSSPISVLYGLLCTGANWKLCVMYATYFARVVTFSALLNTFWTAPFYNLLVNSFGGKLFFFY